MPDPQAGELDMALRTLTLVGELLQYNYFPVCVAHPMGMEFDYVATAALLPPHCIFLFVFECKTSFLVGSVYFIDCSAVCCDFVFLQEMSLYSALFSWDQGADFSLDTCCLFPQCVLAIIPLMWDVQLQWSLIVPETVRAGPGACLQIS